jgi:alcohol dehydrogenase class IV
MKAHLAGAWNFPTRVLTGPGRIKDLGEVCRAQGIARPLLVTDKGLAASPIIARVVNLLAEAGLSATLFSDVKSNPTGANLAAGVSAFKAGGHDGVVAVGGGSALDVGKCIAFMAAQTRPVWDFEDIGDWWKRAESAGVAPIVAVPFIR